MIRVFSSARSHLFISNDDNKAENWLSTYERVSDHNRCDNGLELNNVDFYVTRVTNLWFENHQARMETWSALKTEFVQAFNRPALRKLGAEHWLRLRAQRDDEM